ncbi:MAG: deoxynucleoside kinase [bacterium]
MRRIVAIEGIVHAGKSSLIAGLEKSVSLDVQCIAEYCDFAGGGKNFPGFPKDIDAALGANIFFYDLESRRFDSFSESSNLVILDRSIFSVLAYHYATEFISQGRIKCFEKSLNFFRKEFPGCFPDLCIYLSISTDEQRERHRNDGFYEGILLNREFNDYLMEFYSKIGSLFPEIELVVIDGRQDRQAILLQVEGLLNL